MDHSSWKHAVIESREDILRRYFCGKDVSGLNSRECISDYAHRIYYEKTSHDVDPNDRGYMVFDDSVMKR